MRQIYIIIYPILHVTRCGIRSSLKWGIRARRLWQKFPIDHVSRDETLPFGLIFNQDDTLWGYPLRIPSDISQVSIYTLMWNDLTFKCNWNTSFYCATFNFCYFTIIIVYDSIQALWEDALLWYYSPNNCDIISIYSNESESIYCKLMYWNELL